MRIIIEIEERDKATVSTTPLSGPSATQATVAAPTVAVDVAAASDGGAAPSGPPASISPPTAAATMPATFIGAGLSGGVAAGAAPSLAQDMNDETTQEG